MPKSAPPPKGGSSRGGPTRRAAPTKVSKPFPWGTVLGSLVLATVLIGVITYAALNQGSGISSVLTDPDNNIEGVAVTDVTTLEKNHVQGSVDYPMTPPVGGNHNAAPQQCAVYTAPVAPEHALHSMEHGAVWITYLPSLPEDQINELANTVGGDPYLLMSPQAEQDSPITLSAWGRQLKVETASDSRVDEFINAYRNGPTNPEPGAACAGNNTTGPVRGAAARPPSAAPSVPVSPVPSAPPVVPSPVPSPATS